MSPMTMKDPVVELKQISKKFVLHNQNSAELAVLSEVNLSVKASECVVLDGPSGMGKSTLLKLIYANYRATHGELLVQQIDGKMLDLTQATPRELVKMRRESVGYVSQFLRVIPRVSALDIVAEPLIDQVSQAKVAIERGDDQALEQSRKQAREQASAWLERLRIPERLWHLPPATFSGGEQQRINIARNMIKPRPILLLDEPTASLDAANTQTVIALIRESVERGAAVIGIFHDAHVGQAVATRRVDVAQFRKG